MSRVSHAANRSCAEHCITSSPQKCAGVGTRETLGVGALFQSAPQAPVIQPLFPGQARDSTWDGHELRKSFDIA